MAKRRRDPDALHRNDRREGFGRSAGGPGTGEPSPIWDASVLGVEIGKSGSRARAAPSGGLDKIIDRGSIPLPSMPTMCHVKF
jgi:hypothetical protein